jgi:hypothetical protein
VADYSIRLRVDTRCTVKILFRIAGMGDCSVVMERRRSSNGSAPGNGRSATRKEPRRSSGGETG